MNSTCELIFLPGNGSVWSLLGKMLARLLFLVTILVTAAQLYAETGDLTRHRLRIATEEASPLPGPTTIRNYIQNRLTQAAASMALVLQSQEESDFLLNIFYTEVENRVFLSLELYDMQDRALLHAVQRVVFPGLLAEPLLDEAVEQILTAIRENQERFVLEGSVDYALNFRSPLPGVKIWLGDNAERVQLGEIEETEFTAPYYPFAVNRPLYFTAEKEGFWPKTVNVILAKDSQPIVIDPLMRQSYHRALAALSPTRLGLRVGYRFFPFPDSLLVGADYQFWLQWVSAGQLYTMMHHEIRLVLGSYLFLPPDSLFRIAVGLGAAGTFSVIDTVYQLLIFQNNSVDLPWFLLEWNQSGYSIFFEFRLPYVLAGADILPAGYYEPNFSLGGALKW